MGGEREQRDVRWNVMAEVRERIEEFVARMVQELGANVECIVLTGSYARGDPRPDSDIDLWVFLGHINGGILQRVGQVVADMKEGGAEINPQCVTVAEAAHPGFRKGFSTVQLHLDGIVLHGQLALPRPTTEEIRQDRDELAAFSLMSARHYVSVQEPEHLLRPKIDKWLLNPLVWAIRYDILLQTNHYIKDICQLHDMIGDPECRRLVRMCRQCRLGTYESTCEDILLMAMAVCARMLGSVSEKT